MNGETVGIVHFECNTAVFDAFGKRYVVVIPKNHRWNRDIAHYPGRIGQPSFKSAGNDVGDFSYAIDHLGIDRFVFLHQQSRNGKSSDPLRHGNRNEAGTFSAHADDTRYWRVWQLDRNFRNSGNSNFEITHLQAIFDR